ncbi:hypothetical protein DCC39_10215 [Pueribacillus theae]|uniref:Antitoxin n=1 Tax=Pueribacillus theae TaxID=2171751 RepID=A0A2U1K1J5_9BACI|nr:hypothetical protein [Pueribacillus theae]PWA11064.1 hypothetical protein DCC39_10215 [Pueribacillus theae]
MTRAEVEQAFSNIIEEINDEDVIILEKGNDNTVIFISVKDFVSTFAEYDLTYASLETHPYFNAGWKEYFDKWRKAGYIKSLTK